MIQENGLYRIPYQERRVIQSLMHAHWDVYQDRLRAMVAFGGLVIAGDKFDIDLLEVIEGWQEKRLAVASDSAELPLRGQLRLFFLTPAEFENPAVIEDPVQQQWTRDLLDRVHRGYEIFYETPPDYARDILIGRIPFSALAPPDTGYLELENPLTLTPKR
jgi:hypothetical protein